MSANNQIERVAVIGATGRIGGAFVKSLLETGKHTVTAIGRKDSKGTVPAGAKSIGVDFDDEASLVSALEGQQFLAVTLSVRAPEDLHSKIIAAAAKAGVPYIMPNIYGGDIQNEKMSREQLYGDKSFAAIEQLKSLGLSYFVLCCGFWYEWSLALPEPWFGFTIKERKVTFYDDGKTRITVSTWDQCGRALAALLSLPVSGAQPALLDWQNKPVYTASFLVSQRDMLDSIHRVIGTTDADWQISYEPTADRYKRGLEALKQGNQMGFATAMYARTFYPNGDGDNHKYGLANESLRLPQEDLDEMTKRAVDMAESDWSPFG